MFLASFSAKYVATRGPQKGSPEFLEKTVGSIHFIPGIYPYGVSLMTPIHFRVLSLILFLWGESLDHYTCTLSRSLPHFRPSGGPIFGGKWVFRNFLKKKPYWLNSFHTWHLSLWGESLDYYTFSFSLPHFRPSGGQIFGIKMGFLEHFEKSIGSIHFFLKIATLCSIRLQNRNLYWIFLDEVGSDQSGGKLSPIIVTACCTSAFTSV